MSTRRRGSSTSSTRAEELRKLREIRQSGGRATEHYKVREEEAVYDVVDEDQYRAIVNKRRREADFVVDEHGKAAAGYADHGDDDWLQHSDDEKAARSAKRARLDETRTKAAEAKRAAREMFANSMVGTGLPTRKRRKSQQQEDTAAATEAPADAKADDGTDELLQSLLGELQGSGRKPDGSAIGSKGARGRQPMSRRISAPAGPRSLRVQTVTTESPLASATDSGKHEAKAAASSSAGNDADAGDVPPPPASADEHDDAAVPPPPHAEARQDHTPAAAASAASDQAAAAAASARSTFAVEELGTSRVQGEDDIGPVQRGLTTEFAGSGTGHVLDATAMPLKEMFWFDAHEANNVVYLFGKVAVPSEAGDSGAADAASQQPTWASCCVKLPALERNLYFLPRDDASTTQVQEEVQDLLRQMAGPRVKLRAKWEKKQYCFELPGIPREETMYYHVRYPFSAPEWRAASGATFSHVFGARTSALETLLLERRIMGPSWLVFEPGAACGLTQGGENPRVSHCRLEYQLDAARKMSVPDDHAQRESPPLSVMSLALKTVQDLETKKDELVAVSMLLHEQVSIEQATHNWLSATRNVMLVRRPSSMAWPWDWKRTLDAKGLSDKFVQLEDERSLVMHVMQSLRTADPDILLGHNFLGFDLDVLLHRAAAHNVRDWSILGRLNRTTMPKLQQRAGMGASTFAEKQVVSGRLVVDTYLTSQEYLNERSYDLSNLVNTQLGQRHAMLDRAEVADSFSSSDQLLRLLHHTYDTSQYAMGLAFKLQVIPLTKTLTCVAGNLWARSLAGQRAERIEYLLLHKFYHLGWYILPDKEAPAGSGGKTRRRGAAKYSGGLVLEPKAGLYDTMVLLMDFNSLYPSIIREFNICFTTVERPTSDEEKAELPDDRLATGVLPGVVKDLIERRKAVKRLIKSEADREAADQNKLLQWDIRQKALKLVANSMYGCLGFSGSRFYAQPLAALITEQGRRILGETQRFVEEKQQLTVVYGDTDSIMIDTRLTDPAEVFKLGSRLKTEINSTRDCLEIDIDGIFKRMLLLKKKKYAALLMTNPSRPELVKREEKGLDLVRRDWCTLSREVGRKVLDELLSDKPREDAVDEIHRYLREVADKVRGGQMKLNKFIITKSLNRNLSEYSGDTAEQPHVVVARAMAAAGKSVQPGQAIPYVITRNETHDSAAKRAMAPDVVAKSVNTDSPIEIDIEYYLAQQIHPPVLRLCDVIAETDAAQLADCLGLDGDKFRARMRTSSNNDTEALDADAEMISTHPEVLTLRCRSCHDTVDYAGPASLCCSKCGAAHSATTLWQEAQHALRSWVSSYYEGWLVCDEMSCGVRTRDISINGRACWIPGCTGKLCEEYTARALRNQLTYLATLFEIRRHTGERLTMQQQDTLRSVHAQVCSLVDGNGSSRGGSKYNWVQMSDLFPAFAEA